MIIIIIIIIIIISFMMMMMMITDDRNDIDVIGVRAGCTFTGYSDSSFNGQRMTIRAEGYDRLILMRVIRMIRMIRMMMIMLMTLTS